MSGDVAGDAAADDMGRLAGARHFRLRPRRTETRGERMGRFRLEREHQRLHPLRSAPLHQRGTRLGDRAGLVEKDAARPRERLQRVPALHEDPAARRASDRRGNRERRRQRQRARTRHDEQCDRVVHRARRIARAPHHERHHGERQHAADEPRGHPVRRLHDRRATAPALLHLAKNLRDTARLARLLDAHADRRRDVHGPGVHVHAHTHRLRPRLAREQRHVELRSPVGDHPIGGEGLARAHLDDRPRQQRLRRNLVHRTGAVDDARRRRRQREQQLGAVRRGALPALLHVAAHEQQEHEHGEPVEVDRTGVANGIDRALHVSGRETERDRDIHMKSARPKRRPRAGEKHAARPENRGRDEREAHPPEEELPLVLHPAGPPGVERGGREHQVAGDRAGHADAHEHRAIFLATHRVPADAAIRMRRVPERVQHPRDTRQRHGVRVPRDSRQRAAHLEFRARDAIEEERHPLDEPDARRAVHALDIQLDLAEPVPRVAHVQLLE